MDGELAEWQNSEGCHQQIHRQAVLPFSETWAGWRAEHRGT